MQAQMMAFMQSRGWSLNPPLPQNDDDEYDNDGGNNFDGVNGD